MVQSYCKLIVKVTTLNTKFQIKKYQLSINTKPIKEYALSLSEGREVSNVGGFQSTKFTEPPKMCEELFTEIEKYLPKKMILSSLSFNINGKNNYNIKHNHEDKKTYMVKHGDRWILVNHLNGLSGVFYIDVPDENMGDIVFDNDRISPKTNDLILFSNIEKHEVEKNKSDMKRISLAFNYGDKV